ncbi:carbohydrate ABC transporter permease [Pseudarthrobacter sp. 1C304]|uniref:carbohydrate ABC transporter permease n=1 Tax=Pseudarthrobacter sp. 1C304 TaxID=3457438 RepID=UPI003FD2878D
MTATRSQRRSHSRTGVLLAVPAAALLALFVLWPIVTAAQYSVTSASGYGDVKPVGVNNFLRALGDGALHASLGRNLVYAAIVVFVSVTAGFFLAYFLYLRVGGWRVLQVLYMVPFVMPVVVVALLWQFILEPENGLVNSALRAVGLGSLANAWLTGEATSLLTVSLIQAWVTVPFTTLILLAAMTSLSDETLEAADLDGANHRIKLFSIVLPSIQSSIIVTGAIVTINCFRSFDLVYLLTRGGPFDSTTIATLYVYVQGFVNNKYGYANAVGIVIGLVLVLVAAVPMVRNRRSARVNEVRS